MEFCEILMEFWEKLVEFRLAGVDSAERCCWRTIWRSIGDNFSQRTCWENAGQSTRLTTISNRALFMAAAYVSSHRDTVP